MEHFRVWYNRGGREELGIKSNMLVRTILLLREWFPPPLLERMANGSRPFSYHWVTGSSKVTCILHILSCERPFSYWENGTRPLSNKYYIQVIWVDSISWKLPPSLSLSLSLFLSFQAERELFLCKNIREIRWAKLFLARPHNSQQQKTAFDMYLVCITQWSW